LSFEWDRSDYAPEKTRYSVIRIRNGWEDAIRREKHRAMVEAELRAAMREKQTVSLQDVLAHASRKRELLPITIRLASEDVATARQLADHKGIGYQTYIKLLLHDTLQKEAGRQSRVRR